MSDRVIPTPSTTVSTVAPHMNDLVESLADELSVCVGCGLCLPHCPTFRITGEEAHSPRGRITLIRSTIEQRVASPRDVREYLDTCVQCRGCEPACPSGVHYGHILEMANLRDELDGRKPPFLLRSFLRLLRHPLPLRLVGRLGSLMSATAGLRGLVPRRMRIRGVSIRQGRPLECRPANPEVWLFTGCVMDAWFRPVHRATLTVLEAARVCAVAPEPRGLCCGALHLHAGAQTEARRMAEHVIESMPGDMPVVVNAAGCGAMLKEYGSLLGSDEARRFSSRIVDIHEWIQENLADLRIAIDQSVVDSISKRPIVVQEPCHLRHVQKVSVADVLEHFVPVIRLDDDGLCCGAGGAYSFVQPRMAADIRSRKSESIHRAQGTNAAIVVTANPGCHLHLVGDGHRVCSSVEIIAEVLRSTARAR